MRQLDCLDQAKVSEIGDLGEDFELLLVFVKLHDVFLIDEDNCLARSVAEAVVHFDRPLGITVHGHEGAVHVKLREFFAFLEGLVSICGSIEYLYSLRILGSLASKPGDLSSTDRASDSAAFGADLRIAFDQLPCDILTCE